MAFRRDSHGGSVIEGVRSPAANCSVFTKPLTQQRLEAAAEAQHALEVIGSLANRILFAAQLDISVMAPKNVRHASSAQAASLPVWCGFRSLTVPNQIATYESMNVIMPDQTLIDSAGCILPQLTAAAQLMVEFDDAGRSGTASTLRKGNGVYPDRVRIQYAAVYEPNDLPAERVATHTVRTKDDELVSVYAGSNMGGSLYIGHSPDTSVQPVGFIPSASMLDAPSIRPTSYRDAIPYLQSMLEAATH